VSSHILVARKEPPPWPIAVENWRSVLEVDLAVVQSFGAFSPAAVFWRGRHQHIEVREARRGGIVTTVENAGRDLARGKARTAIFWWRRMTRAISTPGACRQRAAVERQAGPTRSAYAEIVYDVQFSASGDWPWPVSCPA